MERKKPSDFSVIIPHKNIPQLLERCLASIPQRDDVQVIVVDDGSDPSVVDFDRFPGLGRPDTQVVFTKKEDARGAGHARNVGMKAAKGKWLVFADADDVFLPEIGDMMDRWLDSEKDIVVFEHLGADSSEMKMTPGTDKRNEALELYRRTGDDGYLRYRTWAPWGKFVKRELVEKHGIEYSETAYSNDLMFAVKCGWYAAGIALDDTPVYCYTTRPSSLTGADNANWDSLLIRFREDVRVAEFMDSIGQRKWFDDTVVWRWKWLMRHYPDRARALLPEVRKVSTPREIRKIRVKLFFEPVARLLRKRR